MTEAEKLAQRLTAETVVCSGVMARRIPSQDDIDAAALIREQDAKIKRMAEALVFAITYMPNNHYRRMQERHADALRDAGVSE